MFFARSSPNTMLKRGKFAAIISSLCPSPYFLITFAFSLCSHAPPFPRSSFYLAGRDSLVLASMWGGKQIPTTAKKVWVFSLILIVRCRLADEAGAGQEEEPGQHHQEEILRWVILTLVRWPSLLLLSSSADLSSHVFCWLDLWCHAVFIASCFVDLLFSPL